MKSDITFDTNPPRKRERRYDWNQIAQQLRARPGEWALIFEDDLTSLTTAFRLGGLSALPTDEFEIRTANSTRGITKREAAEKGIEYEPRRCDLWMRYNPNKKESN